MCPLGPCIETSTISSCQAVSGDIERSASHERAVRRTFRILAVSARLEASNPVRSPADALTSMK